MAMLAWIFQRAPFCGHVPRRVLRVIPASECVPQSQQPGWWYGMGTCGYCGRGQTGRAESILPTPVHARDGQPDKVCLTFCSVHGLVIDNCCIVSPRRDPVWRRRWGKADFVYGPVGEAVAVDRVPGEFGCRGVRQASSVDLCDEPDHSRGQGWAGLSVRANTHRSRSID